MPTAREDTLDAGPGGLAPEERSAVAGIRGLRWWVVVLVAFVLAVGGMTVDLARAGELGIVYTVCFPVGAVLAAVWVRRGEMFATWIQPPLLLAVGVPVAVVAGGALPPTGGLTAKVLAVGGPLINGFPVMAITTAVCLAVAFVRSRLQPVGEDDLLADDPDRTTRPAAPRRPDDRPRPEDRRPDDRRPERSSRPEDRRGDDRRADDRPPRPDRPARPSRPDDDRTRPDDRRRPDERRPDERRPDERRPDERRPDERRPDERRPDERRREGNRPARPARPDEPRRDAPGPGVYRVPRPSGGAGPDDRQGPSVPRGRPARRPGPPPDGA